MLKSSFLLLKLPFLLFKSPFSGDKKLPKTTIRPEGLCQACVETDTARHGGMDTGSKFTQKKTPSSGESLKRVTRTQLIVCVYSIDMHVHRYIIIYICLFPKKNGMDNA